MRTVIQRVSSSRVSVDGKTIGQIGPGMCILVGVAPADTEDDARRAAEKIVNLRIFADDAGKMDRSLLDTGGSALIISQFTLFADCRKGRRPSFTKAADPELGRSIYEYFSRCIEDLGVHVENGCFGADMSVEIVNDGPVTILIDSEDLR